MTWPFPGNTRITHPFDEQRPIANPKHDHGAIDVGTSVGSMIIAPERGELYKYCATRFRDGQYWERGEGPKDFPFLNYFYDMFGGIFVLKGASGITHVFCHTYQNQLFNEEEHEWKYIEQKADHRWPVHCYISGPFEVFEGAHIGHTGNSGFSTAPHCHYEMHTGWKWNRHGDRLDPMQYPWENFK